MITIHYFASLREKLGTDGEELDLPDSVASVDGLARHLAERNGEPWQLLLDGEQVRTAVDQTIVQRDHPLHGDEEVAFFPPVTGG